MHSEISGTVDFHEPDDEHCLTRIQRLMLAYNTVPTVGDPPHEIVEPARSPEEVYEIFKSTPGSQYDVGELLDCIVDGDSVDVYRAEYGKSLHCSYARIGGRPCGIIANQRLMTQRKMPGGKDGPSSAMNMPAVIYDDSADKAARFIMDCNQRGLPLLFISDTTGFMVGRDSEQGGIIRSGAKMVNAMANSVVPKISLILNSSYGAGNYAMCGRAFDPLLTFAWPGSKCSVMGAAQAANTLLQIDLAARKRRGEEVDEAMRAELLKAISDSYHEQQDIRYGAARGWIDRIIDPSRTRSELIHALQVAEQGGGDSEFKTGVLQT